LSLVGSIVEQHEGEVFVRSVLNQGSTFGFRLKLARV
jgi:signal transduction histidine kinase